MMKRIAAASAFLLAAAPATAMPDPWASFSRVGALSHVAERVEVTTDGTDAGQLQYKLRFTRTTLRGSSTQWASSRTCPAVRALIGSMRQVTMPHPAPYGFDDDKRDIILDGTSYTLRAPSSDPAGELEISSNIGTPLAAWVDAAFDRLTPCWSSSEAPR